MSSVVLSQDLDKSYIKYEILFAHDEFKKRGLKETTKWYLYKYLCIFVSLNNKVKLHIITLNLIFHEQLFILYIL